MNVFKGFNMDIIIWIIFSLIGLFAFSLLLKTNVKVNKIASNNYVVTCHRNSKKCDPVGKSFDEDFPVYLVKYSRFGMVSKYKWSFKRNDWISR